jgi:hypothetical protein
VKRRRERLAELEAELVEVRSRLAEYPDLERSARLEAVRAATSGLPLASADGKLRRLVGGKTPASVLDELVKARLADEALVVELEAESAALRSLLVEDDESDRADAAGRASAALVAAKATEEAAARAVVDAFHALREAFDAYVPAASALETARTVAFSAEQAAGLASDFAMWQAGQPGWTLSPVPRTFEALLQLLYAASTDHPRRPSLAGLVPTVADPEHAYLHAPQFGGAGPGLWEH